MAYASLRLSRAHISCSTSISCCAWYIPVKDMTLAISASSNVAIIRRWASFAVSHCFRRTISFMIFTYLVHYISIARFIIRLLFTLRQVLPWHIYFARFDYLIMIIYWYADAQSWCRPHDFMLHLAFRPRSFIMLSDIRRHWRQIKPRRLAKAL